jgi:hypothetical protein
MAETIIQRYKFNSPNRNVDPVALTDSLYYMKNAFRDETLSWNRRPALGAELVDFETDSPIDGTYWWRKKDIVVIVSNGRIFSIDSSYVITELSAGVSLLEQRGQCTFIEVKETSSNKIWLFIANGGRIVYTDGVAGGATKMVGADDPVSCTHVTQVDGVLIANDTSSAIKKQTWITAIVNAPLTFTGGEDYTAPRSVDDIVAIIEANHIVYIIGTDSVEPWSYTGEETAFYQIAGALIDIGAFSADSVTKYKRDIYLLSNNREIVLLRGYTPITISFPYNRFIQQLETINDVKIEVVSSLEGYDFLLCHFPSEGITLAHNITLYNRSNGEINDWYEWTYWSGNAHTQFRGINSVYAAGWGDYLIGDRLDSKLYGFSKTNLTDAGTTVKIEIVTGHIDHGIWEEKSSDCLKIKGKRGETAVEKTIYIYWRDNGDSEWSNAVENTIDSGSLGDREFIISLFPMGTYITRQYKIIMGDEVDFIICGFEEKLEVISA